MNTPQTPTAEPLAPLTGSVEYKRGYASGYQAGWKRGLREKRAAQTLHENKAAETGDGYVCRACGIQRPRNWFVYEVEKDGSWLKPCCAMCARENKSRGPFPPNDGTQRPGTPDGSLATETRKPGSLK